MALHTITLTTAQLDQLLLSIEEDKMALARVLNSGVFASSKKQSALDFIDMYKTIAEIAMNSGEFTECTNEVTVEQMIADCDELKAKINQQGAVQ